MDNELIEMIKWSPVMSAMLYMIFNYASALKERDKRINDLIDRCVGKNPCEDSQSVDKKQ